MEAARAYEVVHQTTLTDSMHYRYMYMTNALPDHWTPQFLMWRGTQHFITNTAFRALLEDHCDTLEKLPLPDASHGSALPGSEQQNSALATTSSHDWGVLSGTSVHSWDQSSVASSAITDNEIDRTPCLYCRNEIASGHTTRKNINL